MSKEENKSQVPKLRFKGFTDDWMQYKLGTLYEIITGGTPSKKNENYWFPKEIPWLASGEINKNRIYETDDMISKNGYENSSAKMVPSNSILIALAGQGKTRGKVAISYIDTTTNQSLAAFVSNTNDKNEFLYHSLKREYDKLRAISSGNGTRGGLNKKLLSNYKLNFPSLNEQYKISNLLEKLDSVITLEQEKLKEINKNINFLLRNALARSDEDKPNFHFNKFNNDWINVKLGDISDISTGNMNAQDAVDNGKYPFYTRSQEIKLSNQYSYDEEAILIPGEGRLGEIYHYVNGKYALHQRVYRINNFRNNVIGEFVYWNMKIYFKRHILSNTSSTTAPSIRKPALVDYKLRIPNSLEEQQNVITFLKSINDIYDNYKKSLISYKNLKEYLLNNLFV